MHYSEHAPSLLLAPYIKTYWFLEGEQSGHLIEQPQRIFPDGCIECIIHYGEPFGQKNNGVIEKQQDAFVFGQLESFIELIPSARMGIMGIKFFPDGLSAFTRVPVFEIKETAVSVTDLFGGNARLLADQISESNSFKGKISIAENFFISQMGKINPRYNITTPMLKDIFNEKGQMPVQGLVKKYRLSEKQIERIFLRRVGISPKLYSRILRFQQVFKLVVSAKNLTQLAIDAGYFDQSHFVREFRSFTGYSPRQYFNTDDGLTQLFLNS